MLKAGMTHVRKHRFTRSTQLATYRTVQSRTTRTAIHNKVIPCQHTNPLVFCRVNISVVIHEENLFCSSISTKADIANFPDNYVHDNGDAGLAMMESFDADVSDNIFENNKYGVRLSVGSGRNVFSKNVISGSTRSEKNTCSCLCRSVSAMVYAFYLTVMV